MAMTKDAEMVGARLTSAQGNWPKMFENRIASIESQEAIVRGNTLWGDSDTGEAESLEGLLNSLFSTPTTSTEGGSDTVLLPQQSSASFWPYLIIAAGIGVLYYAWKRGEK